MSATEPSPFLAAVRSPIAEKDGSLTWVFKKLFQDWDSRLTKGLNLIGQFTGNIADSATIGARPEGIGTTVQNLDSAGVVKANGVDFTRAYLNKNTDNIADGSGNPLQGGRAAFQALIASGPVTHNTLVFSGSNWLPGSVPYSAISGAPMPSVNTPHVASEWLDSYTSATGAFTQSQPAFSDISGNLASGQLPVGGLSVTIVTAQLTTLGAQGSMTFTNGILTAQTPAT